MSLFGFMHIYAVNNWEEIVSVQIDKIRRSGLMDKVSKIFVGINGDIDIPPMIASELKMNVIYQINKPDLYEALTLSFLRTFCFAAQENQVFYIHTKGVSHHTYRQRDWREMMEYYIIEKYEWCLEELKKNHIVGVNWHFGEGYMRASAKTSGGITVTPHFAGNFWWANSHYISSLPPHHPPVKSRFECEFWIGKSHPLVAELWKSGIYHHRQIYPRTEYEGKKNVQYYRQKPEYRTKNLKED